MAAVEGTPFVSLLDIVPSPVRGVIRIGEDCPACERPVAVMGMPGKGRPLETFARDYFCRGHALRLCAICETEIAVPGSLACAPCA